MSLESDWFKLSRSKRQEVYKEARRRLGRGESLGIPQLWNVYVSLKVV